jgi:hypothetical protein
MSEIYLAKHPAKAKVVSCCLMGAHVLMVAFFLAHISAVDILWVGIFSFLLAFCCFYAYRVFLTKVQFADEDLSIRIGTYRLSEKYRDITEIRVEKRTGTLKLRFTDGKAITLWSGLGDSARIAEILSEKTDVLPQFVSLVL